MTKHDFVDARKGEQAMTKQERIQSAMRAIINGDIGLAAAARKFEVNYFTLWQKLKRQGVTGWKHKEAADRRPIADRVWDSVDKRESGCWIWVGRSISCMTHLTKGKTPRNVVREMLGLPLIKGGDMSSACGTRECINPEHSTPALFERRNEEIRARWEKSEEAKKSVISQVELAKVYGLTRQRIEQIVNHAPRGKRVQT